MAEKAVLQEAGAAATAATNASLQAAQPGHDHVQEAGTSAAIPRVVTAVHINC